MHTVWYSKFSHESAETRTWGVRKAAFRVLLLLSMPASLVSAFDAGEPTCGIVMAEPSCGMPEDSCAIAEPSCGMSDPSCGVEIADCGCDSINTQGCSHCKRHHSKCLPGLGAGLLDRLDRMSDSFERKLMHVVGRKHGCGCSSCATCSPVQTNDYGFSATMDEITSEQNYPSTMSLPPSYLDETQSSLDQSPQQTYDAPLSGITESESSPPMPNPFGPSSELQPIPMDSLQRGIEKPLPPTMNEPPRVQKTKPAPSKNGDSLLPKLPTTPPSNSKPSKPTKPGDPFTDEASNQPRNQPKVYIAIRSNGISSRRQGFPLLTSESHDASKESLDSSLPKSVSHDGEVIHASANIEVDRHTISTRKNALR